MNALKIKDASETWLDCTVTENGVFVSDWTHTMMCHWRLGHEREFRRLQREFTTIHGKTHTYNIKANGLSYEQKKALAVAYHIARENGNIVKHRLD